MERIPFIVARLLDEVFKDYLWSARLAHDGRYSDAAVRFLPRTPELIALANLHIPDGGAPPIIVYPDPPIGAEELQLFNDVRNNLSLMAYNEYVAVHGGAP